MDPAPKGTHNGDLDVTSRWQRPDAWRRRAGVLLLAVGLHAVGLWLLAGVAQTHVPPAVSPPPTPIEVVQFAPAPPPSAPSPPAVAPAPPPVADDPPATLTPPPAVVSAPPPPPAARRSAPPDDAIVDDEEAPAQKPPTAAPATTPTSEGRVVLNAGEGDDEGVGDGDVLGLLRKKPTRTSLLSKVLPDDPLGMSDDALQAPPHVSDRERVIQQTEDNVRRIARVEADPEAGLVGKRVLQETGRGGYRYVDEKTGKPGPVAPPVKTAGLSRGAQGGITFRDKEVRPPKERPKDDLVPTDDGGFVYERAEWKAKIRPDGTVTFDENLFSAEYAKPISIYEELGIPSADLTGGTFDATDAIMRLAGIDPYAAAKRRFLDDVAPICEELRQSWQKEQLDKAIVELRRTLDVIWADAGLSERQKKDAIFERYSSCNDEHTGRAAQHAILLWIQQRIPEGSANAFTDVELAVYEAKNDTGKPFRPYEDFDVDYALGG